MTCDIAYYFILIDPLDISAAASIIIAAAIDAAIAAAVLATALAGAATAIIAATAVAAATYYTRYRYFMSYPGIYYVIDKRLTNWRRFLFKKKRPKNN